MENTFHLDVCMDTCISLLIGVSWQDIIKAWSLEKDDH